jgi:hypothetical protein
MAAATIHQVSRFVNLIVQGILKTAPCPPTSSEESVPASVTSVPTVADIPGFVPFGVLYYTEDTDSLYWGTGSSQPPNAILIAGGGSDIVVSASLQVAVSTTNQSLSTTSTPVSLQTYAVSLFMESGGTGGAGHVVNVVLSWTSSLSAHTIGLVLPLDSPQILMETYPILVAAGTIISLTAIYGGGATNDPYAVSWRLVQMPQ